MRRLRIWISNGFFWAGRKVFPYVSPYNPEEDDPQWWTWSITFGAANGYDAEVASDEVMDAVAITLGTREWTAGGKFERDHELEQEIADELE